MEELVAAQLTRIPRGHVAPVSVLVPPRSTFATVFGCQDQCLWYGVQVIPFVIGPGEQAEEIDVHVMNGMFGDANGPTIEFRAGDTVALMVHL